MVRETGATHRELFEVTAAGLGDDPAEVIARFFAAAAEAPAAVVSSIIALLEGSFILARTGRDTEVLVRSSDRNG